MTTYYLDTSALVKRYLLEIGSGWVKKLSEPSARNALITVELAQVEAAAAIAARQRASGGISLQDRDDAVNLLAVHCLHEYQLVPTSPSIVDKAVRLTQTHRLRGYDAVHLATAILINDQLQVAGLSTLIFVTADNDLIGAAQSEGMTAENPHRYP